MGVVGLCDARLILPDAPQSFRSAHPPPALAASRCRDLHRTGAIRHGHSLHDQRTRCQTSRSDRFSHRVDDDGIPVYIGLLGAIFSQITAPADQEFERHVADRYFRKICSRARGLTRVASTRALTASRLHSHERKARIMGRSRCCTQPACGTSAAVIGGRHAK